MRDVRQLALLVHWLEFDVRMQDTPGLQDLKLMYYNLLIRYHEYHNSYIDICRCYCSIYEVGNPAPNSCGSCCAQ